MTAADLAISDIYGNYFSELQARGTVFVPREVIFDSTELARLEEIQAGIPEEKVVDGDAGDTHEVHVRRVMTDKPGQLPALVNRPMADQVLDIIDDPKRRNVFRYLFGSSSRYYIRRCQLNRLTQNCFIGRHLDAESNPDYDFAVAIQLGRDFQGGEFVVYPEDGERQIFLHTYGSVLITTCKFRHEVLAVTANERNSLVFFYARNNGPNPRLPEVVTG